MNWGKMPLINKILMVLAIAVMAWNLYYQSTRPSDEEVQRRMQEGLKSLEIQEQIRKMEKDWPKFPEHIDRSEKKD